jgi:hypothetical protein
MWYYAKHRAALEGHQAARGAGDGLEAEGDGVAEVHEGRAEAERACIQTRAHCYCALPFVVFIGILHINENGEV